MDESAGSQFRRELVRPMEGHVAGVTISGNPSIQEAGSAGWRELEQHNPSRVSEHASHLLQGPFLIFHVVERDDRGDPVEGVVRKRHLLRMALFESNRRSKPTTFGDFSSVGLEDDDLGATHRESFRRGARATSDIEQANPGDRSDELAQLGKVGGALPNASPFQRPGQDRHESFLRTLNPDGSSRNLAAQDLPERLRVDVPSGSSAWSPEGTSTRRRSGRSCAARFREDPSGFKVRRKLSCRSCPGRWNGEAFGSAPPTLPSCASSSLRSPGFACSMSEVARAPRRNDSRWVAPRSSSSSAAEEKSPKVVGFDRRFDSKRAMRRRCRFRTTPSTGSPRSSRSATWKIRNGPWRRCDACSETRDGLCCSSSLHPALPAPCTDGLPDIVTPATWPSMGRTSSRRNCEPADSSMYQAARAAPAISFWQRSDSLPSDCGGRTPQVYRPPRPHPRWRFHHAGLRGRFARSRREEVCLRPLRGAGGSARPRTDHGTVPSPSPRGVFRPERARGGTPPETRAPHPADPHGLPVLGRRHAVSRHSSRHRAALLCELPLARRRVPLDAPRDHPNRRPLPSLRRTNFDRARWREIAHLACRARGLPLASRVAMVERHCAHVLESHGVLLLRIALGEMADGDPGSRGGHAHRRRDACA